LWVKYKRDYRSEMTDRVDFVVVEALQGRGKRVGAYGVVFLAAYNSDIDTFAVIV
jgi:DNA ligase-1